MGTDIKMYAERKVGLQWVLCSGFTEDREQYGLSVPSSLLVPESIYQDRTYALFAILANVRNPAWSATPYEPIALPRGLPSDLSEELGAWAAFWQELDNASWLMLWELECFPWRERRILKQAMVSRSVAHLFSEAPTSFPFAQWPESEPVSYSEFKGDGVTVNWLETYADSAGERFLGETMSKLRSYGPPNEVRVVFWFNS